LRLFLRSSIDYYSSRRSLLRDCQRWQRCPSSFAEGSYPSGLRGNLPIISRRSLPITRSRSSHIAALSLSLSLSLALFLHRSASSSRGNTSTCAYLFVYMYVQQREEGKFARRFSRTVGEEQERERGWRRGLAVLSHRKDRASYEIRLSRSTTPTAAAKRF